MDIKKLKGIIPNEVYSEIERIMKIRRGAISEIRLRALGCSSVLIDGEYIILSSKTDTEILNSLLKKLCDGAIYAFRESISCGYITLHGGIRVGICADARYEGGAFVGVGDVYSLTYRIPTYMSECTEELYSAFKLCSSGMLIYSSPGCGKTTALRSLVRKIAECEKGTNISVIDERREFYDELYRGLAVDIFSGYNRAHGLEIALRSASPSVLVLDEVGSERESRSFLGLLNSGVKILASAHAAGEDDVRKRSSLSPFFEHSVFDVLAGISIKDGRRVTKITRSGV